MTNSFDLSTSIDAQSPSVLLIVFKSSIFHVEDPNPQDGSRNVRSTSKGRCLKAPRERNIARHLEPHLVKNKFSGISMGGSQIVRNPCVCLCACVRVRIFKAERPPLNPVLWKLMVLMMCKIHSHYLLSLLFPACFSLPPVVEGMTTRETESVFNCIVVLPSTFFSPSQRYGIYRSCFPVCWQTRCDKTVVKASTSELTGPKNWASTGTLLGSCFCCCCCCCCCCCSRC